MEYSPTESYTKNGKGYQKIPKYIQEIYIWTLVMEQPLSEESLSGQDISMRRSSDGRILIIDLAHIYYFLKKYLIK